MKKGYFVYYFWGETHGPFQSLELALEDIEDEMVDDHLSPTPEIWEAELFGYGKVAQKVEFQPLEMKCEKK